MKLNTQRKLITAGITASTVAAAALSSMAALAIDFKHVAVAPENIDQQRIQAADTKGIFSHSTMVPVTMADVKGNTIEKKVFLDGPMNTPIILLSPDAGMWKMTVTNPLGKVVYNEIGGKSLAVNKIAVGPQSFDGKQVRINEPMAGEWSVKLTRQGHAISKAKKDILGYLAYKGDKSFQAYSHLDSNYTTKGSDVNAVARMVDSSLDRGDRKAMIAKEALVGAIDSAVAFVTSPSGKRFTLSMNDDGVKGDKVAGDGIYGVKLPTAEVGTYINQVQIRGMNASGKAFTRTTTDLYPVAEQSFDFSAKPAQLKIGKGTSGLISVPVNAHSDVKTVHMSAEVWGTDAQGKMVAATWVGGVVSPEKGAAELRFDTRWVSRLGLKAPFALKSVRLQDTQTNVPLAAMDEMKLTADAQIVASKAFDSKAIDQDMLMGKAPTSASVKGSGSKLLLVHGYCSGKAWYESEFTDADEFQNYNQNVSHDTFAQRVRDFGNQYNSYGIVAHSQGGAAALTLYSRYWSGLDNASGGRLIQSVGTPYQGTALAGNLAAIGDVFGAGCGTNTDLTYNGASNWLSTIPSWAKDDVNFYTTSFDTAWWRYDYCHLATDLFLDDPEDGTTEKWSGQLSGGVNRGHTKGQCHTASMRDPAQTRDRSRNSSMSSNAAR